MGSRFFRLGLVAVEQGKPLFDASDPRHVGLPSGHVSIVDPSMRLPVGGRQRLQGLRRLETVAATKPKQPSHTGA